MKTKRIAIRDLLAVEFVIGAASAAELPRSLAPNDVELYIISPKDGEAVTSPVTVQFGLRGMGIAPPGVTMANTEHQHLLIDTDPPPFNRPVPTDENHVHFGKGQTEAVVKLAPGRHKLQLLLGDHLHIPHDPPVMSKPIAVVAR